MTIEAQQKVRKILARPRLRFESAILREQATVLKAEMIARAQPGDLIEGEGIFVGKWEPKDREGISLGKIFNVFAAPTDLMDDAGNRTLLTYTDTVKAVASLKNWHGHNGADFENDTALYAALKSDAYTGRWFIPTRELLMGTDLDGSRIQENNLYNCKDKGKLAGTFNTAVTASGSDFPVWYWSSTELRDNSSYVPGARFSDGVELWDHKDKGRLSCHPVRLVAATAAPAPPDEAFVPQGRQSFNPSMIFSFCRKIIRRQLRL